MIIVQPNCLVQFTPDDFALITQVLGGGDGLQQLLRDDDTLPDLLDDPDLIQALQDRPTPLHMSAHLYFYLLSRKVLREAQLLNRQLAEYIAELLVHFADAQRMRLQMAGGPRCEYFYEMLMALQTADADTAFRIRAHMGSYALFMVGLFPERIQHRANRKGAPSVRYYAGLGASSYHVASEHHLAFKYAVSEVYSGLAENFGQACQALHRLAERYLFLNNRTRPARVSAFRASFRASEFLFLN